GAEPPTRPEGGQEPGPAFRRCILGAAPPFTSEPCAFSRRGASPSCPSWARGFLRSRASRILAFTSARSSLASSGLMPPPCHQGGGRVERLAGRRGLGGLRGA